LPGERDNARNNARCTQARKTTHGLDGQHQDVDGTLRGRVNQNDRIRTNGESTSMVWSTLGSRTAKEQNRTEPDVKGTEAEEGGLPIAGCINITPRILCSLRQLTLMIRWRSMLSAIQYLPTAGASVSCLSPNVGTKFRKLPVRSRCNLVGICPTVNARSVGGW